MGKKAELEIEALNLDNNFALRRTRLTEAQLLQAESAYQKLGSLALPIAVDFPLEYYQAPIKELTVQNARNHFMIEKTHSNRRK